MASVPGDRASAGAQRVPDGSGGADPYGTGLQKLGAASGILFVLFLIAAIVVGDATAPDYSAPAAEYESYAADHADKLKVGLLLMLFAGYWLLWFTGVLRSALGAAETGARGFVRVAHVALTGGIVAAIGAVLGSAVRAAAVNEPQDAGGETIRAMVHVSDAMGALLPLGLATLLVASGLVMSRTRAFPRWLGIVALVAGAIYVLLFFFALMLDDDDAPLAILWPVAMLGLLVWTIGTSLTLIKRVGGGHSWGGPDGALRPRE